MPHLHSRSSGVASIRPLRDRLILYLDDSEESRRTAQLIEDEGITPVVMDGPVEPLQRKPLLIYGGGMYEGLSEITKLLALLRHWSERFPDSDTFEE